MDKLIENLSQYSKPASKLMRSEEVVKLSDVIALVREAFEGNTLVPNEFLVALHDDLLMRGDKDSQNWTVVNLGNGLWSKLKAMLQAQGDK